MQDSLSNLAGLGDAADQARIALGHPAEHEERGAHPRVGEHRQQSVGVGLDAAGVAVPGVRADDVGEGRDVEVVLHVDRHGIDNRF